jgi:vesicle coat complex subunit
LDTDTASPAITPSEISFVSFHQPNNLAPHQFEEKNRTCKKISSNNMVSVNKIRETQQLHM